MWYRFGSGHLQIRSIVLHSVDMSNNVSAAFYKLNLHCPDCAHKIKRPLLRIQGVHSVDVNFEKNEVKVVGVFDAKKIHERLEKLSKRKVELLKVDTEYKETVVVEKVVKEIKEPVIHTSTVKVLLHCDQCVADLRRKLLKHKGIYSVEPDMKAQTLKIEGTLEGEKLVKHIRGRLKKFAELVPSKEVKKEVKKEEVKKEEIKEEVKKEEIKEEAKKEETKEEKKVVEEPKNTIKVIDVDEVKQVQEKLKATNTPYIIHYVYAPQWFSDEDPNACSIM